jgi:hypothetical protein
MQLRNGKFILDTSVVHENSDNGKTNNMGKQEKIEKNVSGSCRKTRYGVGYGTSEIISLPLDAIERNTRDVLSNIMASIMELDDMPIRERFPIKIELFRKLYEIIDTRHLMNNYKFAKFTETLKKKTKQFIEEIDSILYKISIPGSEFEDISRIVKNNSISLQNEMHEIVYLS